MCTFQERISEYSKEINSKQTFVEIMQSLDTTLRNWVATDLHDETKASLWTIINAWGSGRNQPLPLQKSMIAKYFGKTSEELFPKK